MILNTFWTFDVWQFWGCWFLSAFGRREGSLVPPGGPRGSRTTFGHFYVSLFVCFLGGISGPKRAISIFVRIRPESLECMRIYIYIYIQREREREIHVYVCIYIYIYTSIPMFSYGCPGFARVFGALLSSFRLRAFPCIWCTGSH